MSRLKAQGQFFKKWDHTFTSKLMHELQLLLLSVTCILNYTNWFFRQKRVKTDIEVNEDNDSVFYRQPVYYHFRPDLTQGSLEDVISVVNLPFIVSAIAIIVPVGIICFKVDIYSWFIIFNNYTGIYSKGFKRKRCSQIFCTRNVYDGT